MELTPEQIAKREYDIANNPILRRGILLIDGIVQAAQKSGISFKAGYILVEMGLKEQHDQEGLTALYTARKYLEGKQE